MNRKINQSIWMAAGLMGLAVGASTSLAAENLDRQLLVDNIAPDDMDYYGLEQAPEENRFVRATFSWDSFFDSNIFLDNTNEQGDWVNSLRPGIEFFTNQSPLDAEHYFQAGYDAEFLLFMENDSENSINHRANALYRYNASKGFIQASHDFAKVEGADRDIGNRTEVLSQNTIIRGEYELTRKIRFYGDANQRLRYYDNQNDRHNWHLGGFLMYQVLPKTKIGLGTKVGWVDIQNSPNQTYQQALGRIIWEPTGKLTVDARFGADFREFHQLNARGSRVSPAGSLELRWDPLAKTMASLTAYYNVEGSSFINNSNFDAVGIQAKIRQNFSEKVSAILQGGYENADYYATTNNFTSNREDDYGFVRGSIIWEPYEWLSVEPFYRFSTNDSSIATSSFDRHQTGVQATLTY